MMPRFIFTTRALGDQEIDRAFAMAATRFPEIRIEHRYTGHGADQRETWVCSAPSRSHIARLSVAADIDVAALQQVDEPNNPHAAGRASNNKETSE